MEDGLLSLKWNNHKSTFFHILSSLRKKETYTDATLACEGKFFPVHKLVMSTCSDYFCEVFENTNCKSPVVILKDIKYHDLEALLDYMYLGEVDVKQNELAGLIKAAECLRIKGLAVPDEDPALSPKKTHIPESRLSPSAKRARRENVSDASSNAASCSNLNHHSLSPSRSHSSTISTTVPSQSVNSDTLPQVPSLSLPPSYTDKRHSNLSVNDNQKHIDQSDIVPVEMIKVEVDDENSSNSQLQQSKDRPIGQSGSKDNPRGEGSGNNNIEESHRDRDSISNNFSDYSAGNQSTDIEKEEHDQIDPFNESDQVAGPSGVQGGSQIVNWGEEEGSFPHNLFGNEDSSHQQVTGKKIYFTQNKEYEVGLHSYADDLEFMKSFEFVSVNNNVKNSYFNSHSIYKTDDDDYGFEGFEKCYDNLSAMKRNFIYDKFLVGKIQGKDGEKNSDSPMEEDVNESFDTTMEEDVSNETLDTTLEDVNNDTLINENGSTFPVPNYDEMTPFELIAQAFEEELECLPCIGFIQENGELIKSQQPLTSSPRNQPKFYCYNCSQTFKAKKDLSLHLSDPHSCPSSCPICPYKGQDLKYHIRFHSESNVDGMFICLFCRKTFITDEEFLDHLKEDHTY